MNTGKCAASRTQTDRWGYISRYLVSVYRPSSFVAGAAAVATVDAVMLPPCGIEQVRALVAPPYYDLLPAI